MPVVELLKSDIVGAQEPAARALVAHCRSPPLPLYPSLCPLPLALSISSIPSPSLYPTTPPLPSLPSFHPSPFDPLHLLYPFPLPLSPSPLPPSFLPSPLSLPSFHPPLPLPLTFTAAR